MNGVKFGDIHSYNDLHLIMQPFAPTPAKPKTSFLKVPGRDGTLDLTEAHGEVKYNDRVFTFTFVIAPGDKLTFDSRVTMVSNAINGRRCKIVLDRDPQWCWDGRCEVSKVTRSRNNAKIVVKATVKPYKVAQQEAVISLSENAKRLTIPHSGAAVIPTIHCTDAGAKVSFGGATYTLPAGESKTLDIRFVEGNNILTATGTGTMTITWERRSL